MFEAFLVTFREGIEAFLVVAITSMYLIKTGRTYLMPAVVVGVVFAISICFAMGEYLAKLSHKPLYEGIFALVAGLLVGSLTIWVARNASKISSDIKNKVDKAHNASGVWKYITLFVFSFFMVAREGAEVAVLLEVISFKQKGVDILWGSVAGFFGAGILGFLWVKYNKVINIGKFLKVTSFFLFLFTIHLVMYGIYELTELKNIPISQNLAQEVHNFSRWFAKGGFAQFVTYAFVVFPVLFMLEAWLKNRKTATAI